MTIESGGVEYSFQGHLVSTEMKYDAEEINSVDGQWAEFRRNPRTVNVVLEIHGQLPVIRKTIEEAIAKEVRNARTHRR